MASAIEKVLEIAATNSFDNSSVQTCLTAVTDLSNNIDTRINAILAGAPSQLDTLNELAGALDNSANFATNVLANIDSINSKITDVSNNSVDITSIDHLGFSNDNKLGVLKTLDLNSHGVGSFYAHKGNLVIFSTTSNKVNSYRKNKYGHFEIQEIPGVGIITNSSSNSEIYFNDTHLFIRDRNSNSSNNKLHIYKLNTLTDKWETLQTIVLDNTIYSDFDSTNGEKITDFCVSDTYNYLFISAFEYDNYKGVVTFFLLENGIFVYKSLLRGFFNGNDTSSSIQTRFGEFITCYDNRVMINLKVKFYYSPTSSYQTCNIVRTYRVNIDGTVYSLVHLDNNNYTTPTKTDIVHSASYLNLNNSQTTTSQGTYVKSGSLHYGIVKNHDASLIAFTKNITSNSSSDYNYVLRRQTDDRWTIVGAQSTSSNTSDGNYRYTSNGTMFLNNDILITQPEDYDDNNKLVFAIRDFSANTTENINFYPNKEYAVTAHNGGTGSITKNRFGYSDGIFYFYSGGSTDSERVIVMYSYLHNSIKVGSKVIGSTQKVLNISNSEHLYFDYLSTKRFDTTNVESGIITTQNIHATTQNIDISGNINASHNVIVTGNLDVSGVTTFTSDVDMSSNSLEVNSISLNGVNMKTYDSSTDISVNIVEVNGGINLKSTWELKQEIMINDRSASDKLSQYNIVSYGDYLASESYFHSSDSFNRDGAVFIFKKNANNQWTQLSDASGGTLKPIEQADAKFGYRIAMHNGYLAASSTNYNTDVSSNVGVVVIYKETNGTWEKLSDASGGFIVGSADSMQLGRRLAMYGDYLVIFNYGTKDKLYIYKNTNGTWALNQTITISQVHSLPGLKINNDWLVFNDAGNVRKLNVYENNNGTWELNTQLTRSGLSGSYYGDDLSLFGNYIAASTQTFSDNGIDIWKYNTSTTSWSLLQTIPDPFSSTSTSVSMSMTNNLLILGNAAGTIKSVKVYRNINDTFTLVKTISGSAYSGYANFVRLIGNDIYVSAPSESESGVSNVGKIIYYKLNDVNIDGSGLNGADTIFNTNIVMTGDLSGNTAKFSSLEVNGISVSGGSSGGSTIDETTDVSLNNLKVHGDLSGNDASFNIISGNNINVVSNLTAHLVSATNYAVGGTNFVSASRQGNFRDLEVKSGSNVVTTLIDGDTGDISINGTLSADTITEKTLNNGVTIEGMSIVNKTLTVGDGTSGTVSATNYNIGSQYIVSATRQALFTALEIKDGTTNDLNIHLQENGNAEFAGDISANKGIFSTNLGVGTSTPSHTLDVNGNIRVTGDISGNDASFNNVDIVGLAVSSLTVGGTNIDTNGSTPINLATTSVSDLSDVSFNTVSSGQVLSWNTAGYFEPTTQTSSGNLNSNSDLSLNNLETIDISSSSISTPSLTTSGTTALGGHIIPDTNASYDLGSAEYKIRHLFLSDNSLWLGDKHKIDVSGGKMRFKKRKIGTGFVPQEILDASGGSTAGGHIAAVIAKFGDVTDADDIELHHWYEYIQDPATSGITAGTLLPHQIFVKDDNFDENKDLMSDAIVLPTVTEAQTDSPAAGTMRYDTTNNKLYIYNGTAWKTFSPDA